MLTSIDMQRRGRTTTGMIIASLLVLRRSGAFERRGGAADVSPGPSAGGDRLAANQSCRGWETTEAVHLHDYT